jgi:ribose 5-phosphate isomerase B
MKRKLISEQTVIDAARKGERILSIDADTIITDAAKDRAKQLGVKLGEKKHESSTATPAAGATKSISGSGEIIAIGSDHGGFQMKEALKPYIESLGLRVVDLGTYNEEACDYPDFAYAVARMVSLKQASRGIMVDAIGVASAMVANKVKGIRAACCVNEFSAQSSREHNDANMLTLGGRMLGTELAKSIVKTWLETGFGGGRHKKRVDKITEIENSPLK